MGPCRSEGRCHACGAVQAGGEVPRLWGRAGRRGVATPVAVQVGGEVPRLWGRAGRRGGATPVGPYRPEGRCHACGQGGVVRVRGVI